MGFGGFVVGFARCGGQRAMALCAAIVLVPWFAAPAEAACTITGSGTQTTVQSSDSIDCTGAGNTTVSTNNGVSNVTVNIGNGILVTTLNGGASAGIAFDTASASTITIFNQAAVTSDNTGILVFGGSNNTINVNAGATIATTTLGSTGIALSGSSSTNTINIGGTIGDLTAGTRGVDITGSSSGNLVNILATGIVQSAGSNAINLSGAGAANAIANQGTISSNTNTAIFGSTNQDFIVNQGTITTGGTTAVDLSGGADLFQLRAGSSITGRVLGGADTDTLSFGGNVDSSFDLGTFGAAQQFREFEQLTKLGSGSWTLTGTTSDVATMQISNGTLIVNGSMANISTFVDFGVLGGSGTIGNLGVGTGGTVAPGNSIGTLNVNGTVVFAAGSNYEVEVNAAGQSDLINATGSATLAGGTVAVVTEAGAYGTTTQYTILTAAGGVTGTFANTTISGYNPLFFIAALSYDANNVFLTLDYNDAAFLDIAETPNQEAVAGAMISLGAAAPFLSQFVGLTNEEILLGLDTLSGEVHASMKGVIGTGPSLFASAVRYRLASAFDPVGRDKLARVAQQGPTYRLGALEQGTGDAEIVPVAPSPYMWLSGAGARGDIDSDGNAAAVDSNARGVFGGLDIPVESYFRLGVAAGWTRTDVDVDARASSADADAWHIAGTGAGAFGQIRIRGALAYGDYDIDTTRTAIIGTDRYTASANYGGHRVEGLLEAGYVMNAYGATFEPYAGAGFSWLRVGSFTETGGGDANLTSAGSTENAPFSVLGLRYTANWNAGGSVVTPSLDVAWRHFFDGTDPTSTLAFAVASGTPWTVAGASVGSDAAVISAALEATLTQSLSADVRYQGELSGEAETHAFEGGLKLKF